MIFKLKTFNLLIVIVLLSSCSSNDLLNSNPNPKESRVYPITRSKDEVYFVFKQPALCKRELYPWENPEGVHLPRITKEFFRCKGSSLNPIQEDGDRKVIYTDCEGNSRHSLPLIGSEEGVYPILIDLLNYLQNKTLKKAIVTCGHRCPTHNIYSDRSPLGRVSKHMIGAEVDFYIQGMEEEPEKVIEFVVQYYREKSEYKNDLEYQRFIRYQNEDAHTRIQPWYNKEIYMKIVGADEGRDFDNRHPYPYINIQVRFDRKTNERVSYSWEKANQGYIRW